VDGAVGGDAHIAGEAADEELADLAGSPVGLVALGLDDGGLELLGELVGVADGAARAIRKGLQAVVLVAVEDLVAGLPRNPETRRIVASSRPRAGVRQTGVARP